ncbi:hypothetical protein HaLaN_08710, partial [Haematococcus lacustris]
MAAVQQPARCKEGEAAGSTATQQQVSQAGR